MSETRNICKRNCINKCWIIYRQNRSMFGLRFCSAYRIVCGMDKNIALIDELGGTTKTARALGVPVTTVDSWRARGAVPSWRVDALRRAVDTARNSQ